MGNRISEVSQVGDKLVNHHHKHWSWFPVLHDHIRSALADLPGVHAETVAGARVRLERLGPWKAQRRANVRRILVVTDEDVGLFVDWVAYAPQRTVLRYLQTDQQDLLDLVWREGTCPMEGKICRLCSLSSSCSSLLPRAAIRGSNFSSSSSSARSIKSTAP